MSQKFSSRAALSMMVFILVLTPMSPFSEMFITEAEANSSSRHIYTFSDGSVENIALYQGGADKTTVVAMPKGAEVLDVQVTLSGASSTGWSQVSTDTYEEWMDGVSSQRPYDRAVALKRMENAGAYITTAESCVFMLLQSATHPNFKAVSNHVKEHNSKENPFQLHSTL